MGIFSYKSKPILGIDISSTAVKLIELEKRGGEYKVVRFGAAPIPAEAISDKQINDVEVVGIAIAKALAKSESKLKNAAIAVAGSTVINKTIRMPANLSGLPLEQQITMEAGQHVPYSIDDIYLDYEVIGPTDNDSGSVDVLLTASKKDNVDTRIAALEVAGLKAKVVDVEAFALENACALLQKQMFDNGQGRTIAVVDAGASTTSLTILHNNKAVYHRDQVFGGKQLTETIMMRYDMNFADAGRAKRTGEGLPESYSTEVALAFLQDLAQVINRSIQLFFAASPKYNTVDQVLLAGGCGMIEGAANIVQDQLGIPVVIANPLQDIPISDKAKASGIERDKLGSLSAAGLALRSFDEERD